MKIKSLAFFRKYSNLYLLLPLMLSAFIHLWNPVGFPTVHNDEDTTYLPRALIFMRYGDPQEQNPDFYASPYFGQILLGSLFKVLGYPDSITTDSTVSIESMTLLYMIPRIIMGLLAVIDTFFIYKIAAVYYDRKVAFIGAVLFAVMPITWILRWTLLDNLLLPFLLSSILVGLYATKSNTRTTFKRKRNSTRIYLILISGILLGLAIFTKIPAISIIPLFIFLFYTSVRTKRKIALWFAPVILIPLIWPLYAASEGHFNLWIKGVLWQAGERIDKPLASSILRFFEIDPILLSMGISGLVYSVLRKDFFLVLWLLPFIILTLSVNYVSLFHLVFMLPPLCIAAAKLIRDVCDRLIQRSFGQIISISTVAVVTIFGLVASSCLINLSLSTSYLKAVSFTNNYIPKLKEGNSNLDAKVTVIGPLRYSWVASYVFEKSEHYYKSWDSNPLPIKTKKILFINPLGDLTHLLSMRGEDVEWLQYIYNNTHVIAVVVPDPGVIPSDKYYPYTSLKETPPSSQKIEIRANY